MRPPAVVERFRASLGLLIIRFRTLLFRLDAIPSVVCCGNDRLLFRLIAGIFQAFDVVRVQCYVNGVLTPRVYQQPQCYTVTVIHNQSTQSPDEEQQ